MTTKILNGNRVELTTEDKAKLDQMRTLDSTKIEKQREIEELNQSLRGALIWQFRMISVLYELGVSKGLWAGKDITNQELKTKYADWKTKLTRLEELGE